MEVINQRFKLISKLGKGNYGITYRAIDLELNREVALKMVDINFVNNKDNFQLLEQFNILSYISNPFIIKPYFLDKINTIDNYTFEKEAYFYTMTLIRNSKLIDEYIYDKNPNSKQFLKIISQICYSLNYLHSFNISHNDIRESNIIITNDGKPYLLDLFPFNLNQHFHNNDFKSFFTIIKKIISNTSSNYSDIRQLIESIESKEYDYKYLIKKIENLANFHTYNYFLSNSSPINSSLFNFKEHFDKIINNNNNKNLILFHDKEFINQIEIDFFNYIKSKKVNVYYIKSIYDIYRFLNCKNLSVNKLSNVLIPKLKKIETKEKIYFIFQNNSLSNIKLKKVFKILQNETSKKTYLYLFSNSPIEHFKKKFSFYNIYLKNSDLNLIIQRVFNSFEFKKNYFPLFNDTRYIKNILLFLNQNIDFFHNKNTKLVLKKDKQKLFNEKLSSYIKRIYNFDNLNIESQILLYILTLYKKPIGQEFLKLLKENQIIENPLVSIKNLIKNNLVSINIHGKFCLSNNYLQELVKQTIYKSNKKVLKEKGLKILKIYRKSLEDYNNYLILLSKSKYNEEFERIIYELYNKYSIWSYYYKYSYTYDFILKLESIKILKKEQLLEILFEYIFVQRALNFKSNIIKLKESTLKYTCHFNFKKDRENIINTIKLINSAYTNKIDEAINYIDEIEKNNYINKYTAIEIFNASNVLNIKEVSKKYQKIITENYLRDLSINQLLLFSFALAFYIYNKKKAPEKKLQALKTISYLIYKDSSEINNLVLKCKSAHNLAYCFNHNNDIKSAIKYYNKAIAIYDKFKLNDFLSIAYNNLAIIHEEMIAPSKTIIDYYEKAKKYALKSEYRATTLLVILLNLQIEYFFLFDIRNFKKTTKQVKKYINKNDKIGYNLRFYSIQFMFNEYLMNKEEAKYYYQLANKKYNSNSYQRFHISYFSYSLMYNLFNKNIKGINSIKNKIDKTSNNEQDSLNTYYLTLFLYGTIFKEKRYLYKIEIINSKDYFQHFYQIIKLIQKEKYTHNELNPIFQKFLKNSFTDINKIEFSFIHLIAYYYTYNKEFLITGLQILNKFINKLPQNKRKLFLNNVLIRNLVKLIKIDSSYIKNSSKLKNLIINYSSKLNFGYKEINKLTKKIFGKTNIDFIEKTQTFARYLVRYGFCSHVALYKADKTLSIEVIYEKSNSNFIRISHNSFDKYFNKLIHSGKAIYDINITSNTFYPKFFGLFPIQEIDNIIENHNRSIYNMENFTYFFEIETVNYINPFINFTKDFFKFFENFLSIAFRYQTLYIDNLFCPLTNVYMRNPFLKRVKMLINKINRGTMFFIDIDDFKKINDQLGHNFGDKVLKEISNCIKSSIRENDFVGRYGGEEFLVFIPHLSYHEVKKIAERINENIIKANIIDNYKLSTTIGISEYPSDSSVVEILVLKSEIANRYGKKHGKNCVIKYSKDLQVNKYNTSTTGGLIVRDATKTSENAKFLVQLINLQNNSNKDFILKCINIIQKATFFDFYNFEFNGNIFSNSTNKTKNFEQYLIKNKKELKKRGLLYINDELIHYLYYKQDNLELIISNNKDFRYNHNDYSLVDTFIKVMLSKIN